MSNVSSTTSLPLIVDLDHTLVRTDVGVESLVALLFQKPLSFLLLPLWRLKGLAFTKRCIIERVKIAYGLLPVNADVVEYVRAEASRGRKTLLVTASDQSIADACASRFGCFSEAVGSNGATNLKGPRKAEYLNSRFGVGKYCYVGDSAADLSVWRSAGAAVVVDFLGGRRIAQAKKLCPIEKEFKLSPMGSAKAWLKELRVHQWAKNLLLLLPLILAHEISVGDKWIAALLGIAAFSMVASAVYLLNDISDLNADRAHERKSRRPLASGLIRIESAISAAIGLLAVAGLLVFLAVPHMAGVLGLYFILTCAYTWWGKEQLALDIMMLAGLYCVRILAGGVVAEVPLSQWLLTFAGFLFVSLACVKRVAELSQRAARGVSDGGYKRRAYDLVDLPVLTAVGVGTGLLSVLVCALYFSGAEVTALYHNPAVLFSGLLPVMTFWVARMWLLAGRGSDQLEDPVLFALTDKISLVCAVLAGALVWLAI